MLCRPGSPGIYPITITNTGIASDIYVNGTSANPADDGNQWALCNQRRRSGAWPARGDDRRPGTDQYLVENFSSAGEQARGVIGTTPTCDAEFDSTAGCWAVEGAWQSEGIELIGPSFSSDNSTKWTMTITWTPVPESGLAPARRSRAGGRRGDAPIRSALVATCPSFHG